MKLIVFGATGGTGQCLVEQALAGGHEVTMFARRANASMSRARVVNGDVFDRATVAEAIRGHDAVVSALGTRPWKHVDICSGGVASILPAMQAAGVRRIIAMSSQGVGDSKLAGIGKVAGLLLGKAFRDKHAMEVILADSDRDWIVVRPGLLTNGAARGTWRTDVDGEVTGGKICRADVAAFMLQQLASDDWLRKRPVVVW